MQGSLRSPRLALGESVGAAMAAASPYQLSGHIHHRAAPERGAGSAASRVRLKRIIKKIYIPLPGLAPSSCSTLASFSLFVLLPPPSAPYPCFLCSFFASFTFISVRQICLSVYLPVSLTPGIFGLSFSRTVSAISSPPSLPPSISEGLIPSHLYEFHCVCLLVFPSPFSPIYLLLQPPHHCSHLLPSLPSLFFASLISVSFSLFACVWFTPLLAPHCPSSHPSRFRYFM